MSASSKKKLRKELNAPAMTEKQLQEQKEAKKLRLYTTLFGIAIAVMILVVIVSRILGSGIIPRSTTALTVGDTEISAAELNHYYIDSVQNFLDSDYGQFASLLGLDVSKPLDEQFYNEAEDETWADYFLEQATLSAQNMYALYNDAQATGFTLSDEAKAYLDATIEASIDNFDLIAAARGFSSADSYISAVYGEGCNKDTFSHYVEVQITASEYAAAKNASLTYDDAAIRAEDDKDPSVYSSYTYNSYYLANSRFYEGGTEDENGNKTYSDEEKEAGRVAAEAAANSLLTATTVEELDAAIAALPINADATSAASTRQENTQYANVPALLREWVTGERAAGDIVVIPNESVSHNHEDGEECTEENDTTTVSGYYVVLFESMDKNLTNLVDVRHILVSFEGGTTDSTTGAVTYSDKEKAAAKTKAEEILAAFNAGEKTEEAFGALATEKTTDSGSKATGGLYEEVYPGQMVPAFNDWCFDSARKTGDTGIVETEYGYHVMYFVDTCETTFRDLMIESTLRNNELSAWETALIEANKLVIENTKYVETGLTFSTAS